MNYGDTVAGFALKLNILFDGWETRCFPTRFILLRQADEQRGKILIAIYHR